MSKTISGPNDYLQTEQLKWTNIISWIQSTVKEDRRYYKSKHRSITMSRVKGFFIPNLEQPLFIVGSPRSGTTFLGACIGEIPEISYHFEPVATKTAARFVHEDLWSIEKSQKFYRMVYSWLMRLHLNGDLRFAEKTPRNCFLISFLHQTFPGAQFIHIIRDGRDAALSHSKKPWLQAKAAKSGKRESSGYLHGPYARFWVESERKNEFEETSDIHRCIWAWRRHTESILSQTKKLPPSQYHEVRYENLVRNPHNEATRLLDYLHIEKESSQDRLYQALIQANSSSAGNWKRELSAEQIQQIQKEAGSLLTQLGYVE